MIRLREIKPHVAVGFCLTSAFAVVQEWALPEFCWSSWLAGLMYTWACILTGCLHIIYSVHRERGDYIGRFPFLRNLSFPALFAVVTLAAVGSSLLVFRVYSFMFGFYGIFLSVFARMEPLSLFGENGFINSDFFTPVLYLSKRYWPMVVGLLLANWKVFIHPKPWRRLFLPLESELVPLHVMVLLLPFFSLFAWFLFGERYQTLVIVMLLGVLYFVPER